MGTFSLQYSSLQPAYILPCNFPFRKYYCELVRKHILRFKLAAWPGLVFGEFLILSQCPAGFPNGYFFIVVLIPLGKETIFKRTACLDTYLHIYLLLKKHKTCHLLKSRTRLFTNIIVNYVSIFWDWNWQPVKVTIKLSIVLECVLLLIGSTISSEKCLKFLIGFWAPNFLYDYC